MGTIREEDHNLRQIVSRLAVTERWPNNKLPCDYLVVDTETTGVNSSKDNILQIGLCAVHNCEISHEYSDEDYTAYTIQLPQSAFVGKEAAIKVHGITYERCRDHGIPKTEAYSLLHTIVVDALSKGMFICGHNLYNFDIPFLQVELSRMGIHFRFPPNQVVDTAMLAKAMQLGMLPGEGEPAYVYYDRVKNFVAKGVYYNLSKYCMGRFGLAEKYGTNVDKAHNAGYDCWLTHLVVTEMNKIITA